MTEKEEKIIRAIWGPDGKTKVKNLSVPGKYKVSDNFTKIESGISYLLR